MTQDQRIMLITAYALAVSAAVGVIVMALQGPNVFAGMGAGFGLAVFSGVLLTSKRRVR